ncbi:hypothetical protein [Streptomyces bottropensis]|uniref:hypothetical protein n=1 Tax=Streptomyces bottropensis TaxID=42235 RepID=UPI0036C1E581
MAEHPYPVGTRVRQYGRQRATARSGTATVREVKGPWPGRFLRVTGHGDDPRGGTPVVTQFVAALTVRRPK